MSAPEGLVLMSRAAFGAHFDTSRLQRLGSQVRLDDPVWTDELGSARARARLARAELLVTSWGAELDDDVVAAAPALRAVFHAAGSVRRLVCDAIWRRDIVLTSAADANAVPVAEFTLAAVIFAGKKAPFLAATGRTASGGLQHVSGFGQLSNYRRTVGIVGFSRTGRRVVELLRVLEGTTVLVSDPYADPLAVAAAGAQLVDLPELATRSDVLSIHAPALPETHHLIGADELALLPDHATVVNTARGSLIDTEALTRECASGRLFAILDVTDPEPLPPESPLRRLPSVMLTPHVAGSLGTEVLRMTDHVLDEIDRWRAGHPLESRVDGALLSRQA